MAQKSKPKLVLDTNTFIKCLNLHDLNERYELFTTPEVLAEIRDKKARDKFASLPFEIRTSWPSDSATKFVKTFATKTGDLTSLSETDIDLIALAYTFAEKNKKTDLLRKEPPALTEYVGKGLDMKTEEIQEAITHFESQSNQKEVQAAVSERMQEELVETNEQQAPQEPQEIVIEESKVPESHEILEGEKGSEQLAQIAKKQTEEEEISNEEEAEKKKEDEQWGEEDDDDGGWINITNITKHLQNAKEEEKEYKSELGVTIMTSDYAMQNVLLQIGIPVLSFDGLFIKQTKKFVLKCLGCKRITKQTAKEFCPFCGNHTLTKVTCLINADGTIVYYLKKNYQANTRGCIYSIPKKKGGRADDLLLREDEFKLGGREFQKRREEKEKKKNWDAAMFDYDVGRGFNIKQPGHGNKTEFGYGRKNPNDPQAYKTIRKRK